MKFLRLNKDDKAGLYITAIVHLVAVIVLLAVQIGYTIQKESSFVLDFSKLEEKEQLEREIQLQEAIMQQIEEMLEASAGNAPLRNVRVNTGQALQDDRNTDAEKLYRDAERLAKNLQDGQKVKKESSEEAAEENDRPLRKPEETRPYSGPSVLSWSLDGREALSLPIPAYRCYEAGQVTVLITVNNDGKVVSARIHEAGSTYESCLRNFALRAARMSQFSKSGTAPARQIGTIVYSFIAQ